MAFVKFARRPARFHKVEKWVNCNFNQDCHFRPVQEQEDDQIGLCTLPPEPEEGRCAPCDPRAHRSGPDHRGSPWYTPVPGELRYNPAYRPDSPCWDGKYDNGTYSCHDCECWHPDGICALMEFPLLIAPLPTYSVLCSEDDSSDDSSDEDTPSVHSRHCSDCGMPRTRFHLTECPYDPKRANAKREPHFEGMYRSSKRARA